MRQARLHRAHAHPRSAQAGPPVHLQPLRLVAHGLRRPDARLDRRHKLQIPHQPHLWRGSREQRGAEAWGRGGMHGLPTG